MEGTVPINLNKYGGHPAPTGPALPNLINAVRMFKIKTTLAIAEINKLAIAEINKLAIAEINKLAIAEINKLSLTLILTLTLTY